jgi:dTDP-4-dehydrorhamnose 3,5-epimerase
MIKMEYTPTEIEDVLLIKPAVFTDERGYFFESYRQSYFTEENLRVHFVQDNISFSRQDTLRGLHYQIERPQDKLMMVLQGAILDVAVDLRQSSPTFGESVSCMLSEDNKHQLFVPRGFAHGFVVRSADALVHYKCSDYYYPDGERGLKWNDPALAINWNVESPILSEKDQSNPLFKDIPDGDLFD